jgi:hypothetical protein
LGSAGSGGPHASGTSSFVWNIIWPNSCQVDDSSWPAERMKTSSNELATSSPTAARHAPSPSVRMLRAHCSPAGQAPGLKPLSMPYW